MTPQDNSDMKELVDEYKDMFDIALDTYGDDLENVFKRLMRASARVQKVYYEELKIQGFNDLQAFTLLLNSRTALKDIDLTSRTKRI
jgi:hypothetical protein